MSIIDLHVNKFNNFSIATYTIFGIIIILFVILYFLIVKKQSAKIIYIVKTIVHILTILNLIMISLSFNEHSIIEKDDRIPLTTDLRAKIAFNIVILILIVSILMMYMGVIPSNSSIFN